MNTDSSSISHLDPGLCAVSMIREVEQRFSTVQSPLSAPDDSMQIVDLLDDLNADREMKVVSILRACNAVRSLDAERVGNVFGRPTRALYENALHLDRIQAFAVESQNGSAEQRDRQLGRMIVAIVNDARVVVIHLAEQLARLKDSSHKPQSVQQELAERTLSVYAPLANRLGVWRLKWQLEVLAFKYLNRPEFDVLARLIDEKRVERERYVEVVVERLRQIMDNSGIKAAVNGRAKHIFGIWKKSQVKSVGFEEIYDLRAVRLLVDDIAACYVALGVVHATWSHIAEEFDDYIAMPKENGYQSIHTAVVGPEGKVIEVQIRTHEMHEQCEFGTQAHWKYKEGSKSDSKYQVNKIRWLRHILEWRDETFRDGVGERSRSEDVDDAQIYVFTPAGNVVELAAGSTPIDFSYAIHTEVGHRCRGATVNGRIVPLTRPLETGDWVEIRTVKSGGPSRDWLKPQSAFVTTSRAKHAIGRWFRLEEYGRYQAQGRSMLEKELGRRGIANVSFDKLASQNNLRRAQDLFTAVGMRELKVAHALSCLAEKQPDEVKAAVPGEPAAAVPVAPSLSVYGVENLLAAPAACCGPLPGDSVVGYVTAARGITIHKRTCGNVMRMIALNPEREVDVGWEAAPAYLHEVNIEVTADQSASLLPDITAAASELDIRLISVNTAQMRTGRIGKVVLTVQIGTANQLTKLLRRMRGISNVESARRLTN